MISNSQISLCPHKYNQKMLFYIFLPLFCIGMAYILIQSSIIIDDFRVIHCIFYVFHSCY